jgi:signal transduction histidine kinase
LSKWTEVIRWTYRWIPDRSSPRVKDNHVGQEETRLLRWLPVGTVLALVGLAATQGDSTAVALTAVAAVVLIGAIVLNRNDGAATRNELANLHEQIAHGDAQLQHIHRSNELLLHLARRNQSLLDKQIGLLMELEESEPDPDALSRLFELDHLAMRIRRNAEGLLVLAGDQTSRRWARPVPLTEVVRGAIAEVEDFERAQVQVDDDIELSGRVVADLTNLLAELVENAITYSSDGGTVIVRSHPARGDDGGCVLTVEDRGAGMSARELTDANAVLADGPAVDTTAPGRLGLRLVARLAVRNAMSVHLETSQGGGTTAFVRVPADLLGGGLAAVEEASAPAPAPEQTAEVAAPMPAGLAPEPSSVPVAAAPLRALPLTAVDEPRQHRAIPADVAAAVAALTPRPSAVIGEVLRARTPGVSLGAATPIPVPTAVPLQPTREDRGA